MILTLLEAKAHLYVTHDSDDLLITDCIEAAGDYVAQYIGQALPDPLPASIKQAAKLLVGDYYENREAASEKALAKNPAAENILHFYRVGLGV